MSGTNQLLDSMLKTAKERLAKHDPHDIARKAEVSFDNNSFSFKSLGEDLRVSYPGFDFLQEIPHWQKLTLLHYMDLADGIPLSGRQMPFSAYREGMIRGGGFDRDAEEIISKRLGRMTQETIEKRCLSAGGKLIASNADICVRFDFAPRYPLWMKIWLPDDEFEASGRMFVDENAAHYLTIEDAVTAGSVILDALLTE